MPVALAGRDSESLGVKADDKLFTWGVSHLPTGVGPRPWGFPEEGRPSSCSQDTRSPERHAHAEQTGADLTGACDTPVTCGGLSYPVLRPPVPCPGSPRPASYGLANS